MGGIGNIVKSVVGSVVPGLGGAGGGGLLGGLLGGGEGGGGLLGGLMGAVGGLVKMAAPFANFILPGIGPMIADTAGGLLQGAGGMVSKLEQEAQDQLQVDKRLANTFAAGQDDMRRAAAFAAA